MPEHELDATRDYYDAFFEYLLNDRFRVNPRHAVAARLIKKHVSKGATVLDLGCGIGITSEMAVRRAARVVGVDLSPRLIAYAKESVNGASFQVGDIASVGLGATFDVVCLFDVVEHLPSTRWPELWANVHRHLAPDGRILVTVPHPSATRETLEQSPQLLQIVDEVVYFDELAAAARQAGLLPTSLGTYGVDRDREYHWAVLERDRPPVHLPRRARSPLFASLVVRARARKYWRMAQRVRDRS
jgi:2-polyprenyl-3-methyl-5-hydroxy-6-metoxy-1,4-benzoquinol methylase